MRKLIEKTNAFCSGSTARSDRDTHNHPSRFGPTVGQSWNPEVADFLMEMYPEAIEQGFGLEDIALMVAEDEGL